MNQFKKYRVITAILAICIFSLGTLVSKSCKSDNQMFSNKSKKNSNIKTPTDKIIDTKITGDASSKSQSTTGDDSKISYEEGKESGDYLYYEPFTVPKAKNIYNVELSKFNISNDGSNSVDTTVGINKAIYYAYDNNYDGVQLPKGTYGINVEETPNCYGKGIKIEQLENFEVIFKGCTFKLDACTEKYYRIVDISFCKNVRLTGGTIIGDRYTHNYGMRINNDGGELVQGTIDPSTGKQIASEESAVTKDYITHYKDWFTKKTESIPSEFYVIPIQNTTRNITDWGSAAVYFYDSNNKYLGSQDESLFKKITVPSGATKMKLAFKEEKHLNEAVYAISKLDTTYEFGTAVLVANSDKVVVNGVQAYDCTGDGMGTEANPTNFDIKTCDNLKIINCVIGNNRRQGITMCGEGKNTLVKNTKIYNTNGTDPQCGVDIEHNPGTGRATNICFEGNTMEGNRRWDIDVYNGSYVEIKDNIFSTGIGAVYSDTVSIHDNTFKPNVEDKDNNLKRIFNYLLYFDQGCENTEVYNNNFESSNLFEIYFQTTNGNMHDNNMN